MSKMGAEYIRRKELNHCVRCGEHKEYGLESNDFCSSCADEEEELQCPNRNQNGDCLETERPSGRIKSCLIEHGGECEEWEEIKAEWEVS